MIRDSERTQDRQTAKTPSSKRLPHPKSLPLSKKPPFIRKASLHPKSLSSSKSLTFSFSESFIPSGKQGGGAAVLGEGHDIVTRGTCVPASLNVTNLGKASELHFAFLLSSVAGAVTNLSLQII
jgi:hypothetical protein